MDELIYEKQHTLLMRDCDVHKRVKPSVILALFQDCSEALTEGWGVGLEYMLARGVIWVAARLECDIVSRLPEHTETVTVRGWATRCRSGIFPFRYELIGAGGETLVTGCSMWVLSDLENHSMMSPNIPKITLPTPEPDDAPRPHLSPILPAKEPKHTSRRVRFSEVDINGHLTNTRYFDWMTDLADLEFHRTHPMTGLRIDYRRETFPDEEIVLDWELTEQRLWCSSEGRFTAEIRF
jgi:acyl-ACP thioesterase